MFSVRDYPLLTPLLMMNPAAPFMYKLSPPFPVGLRQPFGNCLTCHLSVGMPSPFSVSSSSPSPTSSTATESQLAGIGLLIVLTNKTGVLLRTCGSSPYSSGDPLEFVQFNTSTFCDQDVDDLTKVLRVGNVLRFQADNDRRASLAVPSRFDHVANFVSPITKEERHLVPADVTELMRKAIAAVSKESCHPTDQLARELSTINLAMELESINFILSVFRETRATECHMNTIHCFVSNSQNHSLYSYIGTNSQKRRQFIEYRRHIFVLLPNEIVCLVPSTHFIACLRLADALQRYGGCMSLKELFDLYLGWPDMPLEAREIIGESKSSFVKFLEAHTPIFAIFPKQAFVSVRNRLAYFDYPSFLMETFGDKDGSSMLKCLSSQLRPAPLVSPIQGSNNCGHTMLQPTSMPPPVRITNLGDNRTFVTSVNPPVCALKAVPPYGNVPGAARPFYQPFPGICPTFIPNGGVSPLLNPQVQYNVDKRNSCFLSQHKAGINLGGPSGQAGSSPARSGSDFGSVPTSPNLQVVHCGTQTDEIPFCPSCAKRSLFRTNVRNVGVQADEVEESDSDDLWDDLNKELKEVVFS